MASERSGGERTEFQTAEEQHELLKHRKYLSIVNCMPKRYVVGIMAFFGFCNIYALRVNLSVAIVAMTENQTKHIGGNKTVTIYPDFTYDAHTKGIILGSFFYGYILTQIPGGYLATRLGGKYLFGGGVFLTALFTLITPLCARWSVYLLVAVRVLEGLFEGVTYPSIHAIWSKWAPPQEKTKLATLAFSGSYIGTVISLPMSAALAQTSAGWPSIFYVFGSIAVLWFFMWCYLVAESPAKHPTISNAELEYIQGNIGYTDEQVQDVSPPWRSILTSLPVWAIVAAHFAENWGFYTWLTELPTFMNNVLHFNMYQAGFLAALPYLVMAFVVQGSGHLGDFLRGRVQVSTEAVRKIFTCGAFAFQVVFMIAAGYSTSRTSCMVCLTIAVGIGGFAWGGFSVNHLDIAPQFASILMGLSNTFATLPGIISPYLTGVIVTTKGDPGQWQIVFYLAAIIYIFGAIVYGLLASGVRQKWAEVMTGYLPHHEVIITTMPETHQE
ncbi:vesicular glutamate transporter 1-like [Mya arenaria]|uniref:vesicular glutamate transporter 1-like n=1 Tax=Mya arenaria TaxID=6604 RepID=UPI0022E57773|nr:vesicular glutamate transporter 1-like [Mya arenaria]XP_052806069.1 vesicular glutamate transporter 1-like [Mya arenaria]